MIEIEQGIVQSYNIDTRSYTVSGRLGVIYSNVRMLGGVVDNINTRIENIISNSTEVFLLVVREKCSKFDGNAGTVSRVFILGGFESLGSEEGLGTKFAKSKYPQGVLGFVTKGGARIIAYPTGDVEVSVSSWCKIMLDSDKRKISGIFQQMLLQKDVNNYIKWDFQPETEDFANSVFKVGISGKGSGGRPFPEIEMIAGHMEDTTWKEDGVELDNNSNIAIKVSPDKNSQILSQIGNFEDGKVLKSVITKNEELIKASIGEFETSDLSGESDIAISEIDYGESKIQVFKGGRILLGGKDAQYEIIPSGEVNTICKTSTLGDRAASKHQTIAEEVKSLFAEIIDVLVTPGSFAVVQAAVMMNPATKAKLIATKSTLNKIFSKKHKING